MRTIIDVLLLTSITFAGPNQIENQRGVPHHRSVSDKTQTSKYRTYVNRKPLTARPGFKTPATAPTPRRK